MPASAPSEMRAAATLDLPLSCGTVVIRRKDFLTLFLEGLFPLPLMDAMTRLIAQEPTTDTPVTLLHASPEDRVKLLEGLRRFAVGVIVEPVFVLEDDGHADHVPVTILTADDLQRIWSAASEFLGIVGGISAEQASTFRGGRTAPVGEPAPVGASLPPETVVVGAPGGADLITG